MNDKLIVSVATTGSWPTRRQTPHLPITPEEIARAAVECWREGAAIVHVHVRDANGVVTADKALYKEVMDRIRAAGSDIIINLSTSGGIGVCPEPERFYPLELKPELASFDAGSINVRERVFENSAAFLERLARAMLENNVKPEIEVFDTCMIFNALRLAEQGLIKPPYFFQLVLGVAGSQPASAKQLFHLVESLPPGAPWSAFGVGRHQLPINALAIALGGHARTGMEDNIYYRAGELATSNAQLVARLVRIGRECGREIASPNEAREMLGLAPVTTS